MTNTETKITHIEIPIDSDVWIALKHTLREAGYKFYFQSNLFDHTRVNLFLERRYEEPEGGKLTHGMIVFDGGATISSDIQETYNAEVGK